MIRVLVKKFYRTVRARQMRSRLLQCDPAFLFHLVGTAIPPSATKLHSTSVSFAMRMIDNISKSRRFLSADQFIEEVQTGKAGKYACLTFDDGYLQTWNEFVPWLENRGIPATFYVNKALVDGAPFWRDQVRHLIDNGQVEDFLNFAGLSAIRAGHFYHDTKDPARVSSSVLLPLLQTFFETRKVSFQVPHLFCTLSDLAKVERFNYVLLGNHSSGHSVLSSLSLQEQRNELGGGHEFLHRHFAPHKISGVFSMPFGGSGMYNETTFSLLKELGYTGVFTSEEGEYQQGGELAGVLMGLPFYKRYLPKE